MIVGIILAAGESKRMGTPKQLLPWGETTVLQRIIDAAAASRLERVILVLGANTEAIADRITVPAKFLCVTNEVYREGMASSLKCGIRNAPAEANGFMLILGDQPLLEKTLIDRLIEVHYSVGGITIPVCDGRRGHPVIFSARYRAELLAIGDRAAGVGMCQFGRLLPGLGYFGFGRVPIDPEDLIEISVRVLPELPTSHCQPPPF